eukprot:2235994-Pyramimonas_sp.AAC.1
MNIADTWVTLGTNRGNVCFAEWIIRCKENCACDASNRTCKALWGKTSSAALALESNWPSKCSANSKIQYVLVYSRTALSSCASSHSSTKQTAVAAGISSSCTHRASDVQQYNSTWITYIPDCESGEWCAQ